MSSENFRIGKTGGVCRVNQGFEDTRKNVDFEQVCFRLSIFMTNLGIMRFAEKENLYINIYNNDKRRNYVDDNS